MKNKLLFCIGFFLCFCFQGYAQLSNYIYALNNQSSGVVYFSRVEISTGLITNFQVASNGFSNNFSACISEIDEEYYLCTGQILFTYDANSGNLISADTLPIPSTANLNSIQFNPCNGNIYGYIYDSANGKRFVRFNPDNGVLITISTLSNMFGGCLGCMATLDPINDIYSLDTGNGLVGLNLNTGAIVYNSPKINLPGESFGHIALKCNTHQIIGTSANVNLGVKYLAEIDPFTGLISHIGNTGWNTGVWKPGCGGDCINQYTGDYYYSGAGHLINGASTTTGALIYSQIINSGELYFIQHFSECNCEISDLDDDIEPLDLKIYPKPFSETLNISTGNSAKYFIVLYDITSRKIVEREFYNSISLTTSEFSEGVYIYQLIKENVLVAKGVVVK